MILRMLTGAVAFVLLLAKPVLKRLFSRKPKSVAESRVDPPAQRVAGAGAALRARRKLTAVIDDLDNCHFDDFDDESAVERACRWNKAKCKDGTCDCKDGPCADRRQAAIIRRFLAATS